MSLIMRRKIFSRISFHRSALTAGVATLLCLCSCGEKEEAKTEVATSSAKAAPAAADVSRQALADKMIYGLGRRVGELAGNPEWSEDVREMLDLLENYYRDMAPTSEGKMERARLALRVAETMRDLTAYEKARTAYEQAQKDFDALPEEARLSPDGMRLQSAIYNGQGSCLLSLGRGTEALPCYEKALASDMALYTKIAASVPADGTLPEGEVHPEVARAAADVLSSYRCLGECQLWSDDPEEARDTYNKGIEFAKKLDKLSPVMTLQYIRLQGALGNLESRCGREREALSAWGQAASFCQRLCATSCPPSFKVQAARYLETLKPSIINLNRKLQTASEAEKEAPSSAPAEEGASPEATPAADASR